MNTDALASQLYDIMQQCKMPLNKIISTEVVTTDQKIYGLVLTKAVWFKLRIFEIFLRNGVEVLTEKSEQYFFESQAIERMNTLIKIFKKQ